MAQVYEDKSVLENFHTVTLIHMLRRHHFDYLLGGDFGHLGDQATSFRKVLEASILATDMSRHFAFVTQLTELGRRFGERRGLSSATIEADRLLLCSGLMKCADISNPVSPCGHLDWGFRGLTTCLTDSPPSHLQGMVDSSSRRVDRPGRYRDRIRLARFGDDS